jgi:hypothetical protein
MRNVRHLFFICQSETIDETPQSSLSPQGEEEPRAIARWIKRSLEYIVRTTYNDNENITAPVFLCSPETCTQQMAQSAAMHLLAPQTRTVWRRSTSEEEPYQEFEVHNQIPPAVLQNEHRLIEWNVDTENPEDALQRIQSVIPERFPDGKRSGESIFIFSHPQILNLLFKDYNKHKINIENSTFFEYSDTYRIYPYSIHPPSFEKFSHEKSKHKIFDSEKWILSIEETINDMPNSKLNIENGKRLTSEECQHLDAKLREYGMYLPHNVQKFLLAGGAGLRFYWEDNSHPDDSWNGHFSFSIGNLSHVHKMMSMLEGDWVNNYRMHRSNEGYRSPYPKLLSFEHVGKGDDYCLYFEDTEEEYDDVPIYYLEHVGMKYYEIATSLFDYLSDMGIDYYEEVKHPDSTVQHVLKFRRFADAIPEEGKA